MSTFVPDATALLLRVNVDREALGGGLVKVTEGLAVKVRLPTVALSE
jgi:hypothetical protein